MAISNVVLDGVPAGGEDAYAVLDVVGEPTALVNPKDHLELGESLGLIDMNRGAKVSGSRFYFLTGRGALLQLGLLQLALRLAVDNGFVPMIPPVLVRPEVMAGTGFLGAHADEVYRLEADDLYLVGTSEVPLAGYHSDEILDLSGGPLRYAGWSSCFRREAGSYGKDTRGIIRVHQFDKVEGFVYCTPDEAEAEHQSLLGWQREMLALIEVSYRVIDVAARHGFRRKGPTASSRRRRTAPRFRRAGWPHDTGTQEASRRSRPRSTAHWAPRGGWCRSWRTTSSPTAACGCRTLWFRSWAPSCWNRRPESGVHRLAGLCVPALPLDGGEVERKPEGEAGEQAGHEEQPRMPQPTAVAVHDGEQRQQKHIRDRVVLAGGVCGRVGEHQLDVFGPAPVFAPEWVGRSVRVLVHVGDIEVPAQRDRCDTDDVVDQLQRREHRPARRPGENL